MKQTRMDRFDVNRDVPLPVRDESKAEPEPVMDEDFPPAARHFLTAFYEAKTANTEQEKMAALKEAFEITHAEITDESLAVLEFYALTKLHLI